MDQETSKEPWEVKLSLREKAQEVSRTVDMEEKVGNTEGGEA